MPSPDIQPSPFKKKPRGGMARLAGWATGRFAVTTKEPKEEERPPDRIIRRSSAEEAHVEAQRANRRLRKSIIGHKPAYKANAMGAVAGLAGAGTRPSNASGSVGSDSSVAPGEVSVAAERPKAANPDEDLLEQVDRLASTSQAKRAIAVHGGQATNSQRAMILGHAFTPEDLQFYQQHPGCAVLATANRIIRSVSTRHKAGGLGMPPPIVGRIFQELSNGLLAYNSAVKMKEVPVPFAYVQYNALMLHFFILVAPMAVAVYTSSEAEMATWVTILLAILLAIFINGAFVAMWMVANELEDPFGTEPNDIPMMSLHNEFCASLQGLLINPWLPRDQWIVKSGRWKKPGQPATSTSVHAAPAPAPALARNLPALSMPPVAERPSSAAIPVEDGKV